MLYKCKCGNDDLIEDDRCPGVLYCPKCGKIRAMKELEKGIKPILRGDEV